jgi:small-conductance mechanosensitive channel
MSVAVVTSVSPPPDTSAEVDEALIDACGASPSWVCEATHDLTGSELTARAVDWFVARPLAAVAIVVVAALLDRWLRRLLTAVITRAVAGDAAVVLDRLSGTTRVDDARQQARASTVAAVARAFVSAVVWTVAALLVLGTFHLQLGPLLAGAGIAGIAVGFGAQSLVKDCIAGFFILLEDQFGVGDEIEVGAVVGTVESVTLRMTRVRAATGTLWSVPNGSIVQVGNRSRNWSKGFVDVLVRNDVDLDVAIASVDAALHAVADDPELAPWLLETPEVLGVDRSDATGTAIRVAVKTAPADLHRVLRAVRLVIRRRLDADGLGAGGGPEAPGMS